MKILKSSGSYLKNKARKKLLLVVICLIAFVILFVPALPNTPFYIDVGDWEVTRTLASLFPLILGMRWWGEYKKFKLGLDGELHVTKVLKSALPDQYYLINDVTTSGGFGNIDHVILAPNGIFVIETKNNNGTITCHGDDWSRQSGGKIGNPSKQAKRNARIIFDIIVSLEKFKSCGLWVVPIVVFSNYDVKLNLNDCTVAVLKPYNLPSFLLDYDGKYDFSQQELDSMGKEILRQTS